MNRTPKRISSRIARRAVHQGARPSSSNQGEVEKSATGRNLPNTDVLEDLREEPTAQSGLLNTNIKNPPKGTRQKWSREEYKEVMESYYLVKLNPRETATTKATYNMWRNKHPTERSYLEANKLATVRRDIEKNQRLSNDELKEIEEKVRLDLKIPEIEEPAAISENTEPEPGTPAVLENVDENNNSIEETYLEDDDVISEMKDNILRKWEVLKEEDMAERPVLPKIKNDKKSKRLIQRANRAIELIKLSNAGFSLTELNQLIYAAAFIITEELGIKPRKTTTNRKRKPPAWKMKIEKDIEMKRKELSILTELEKALKLKNGRSGILSGNITSEGIKILLKLKKLLNSKCKQKPKESVDLKSELNSTGKTRPLKKILRDSTVNLERSRSR